MCRRHLICKATSGDLGVQLRLVAEFERFNDHLLLLPSHVDLLPILVSTYFLPNFALSIKPVRLVFFSTFRLSKMLLLGEKRKQYFLFMCLQHSGDKGDLSASVYNNQYDINSARIE